MKVPDNLIQHVKNEIEGLKYGSVRIEINETAKKIDVITESRERFLKNPNYHNG